MQRRMARGSLGCAEGGVFLEGRGGEGEAEGRGGKEMGRCNFFWEGVSLRARMSRGAPFDKRCAPDRLS